MHRPARAGISSERHRDRTGDALLVGTRLNLPSSAGPSRQPIRPSPVWIWARLVGRRATLTGLADQRARPRGYVHSRTSTKCPAIAAAAAIAGDTKWVRPL